MQLVHRTEYIRIYVIYIYSPFGDYIFNLGDYKFETKFTDEKKVKREKLDYPGSEQRG